MSDKNKLPRAEISILFNNVDITRDINADLKAFTFTDAADGETDNIQIELNDRLNVWMKDWLIKETENRDKATQEIATGGGGETTPYTVTAKIGLNVRSGKGTGYSRIGGLAYGAQVEVVEVSNGWATIRYNGETAFVCAQYLNGSGAETASSSDGKRYSVTADGGLNVRSGKGTGYSRIGGLPDGAEIEVLEVSNGWATINYGGKTAFVSAQYIKEIPGTESPAIDGNDKNTAKFTKICATIVSRNYDGEGHDSVLDCGQFELDDVAVKGPPQIVTMSATSLNYESSIRKTRKSRSWNQTTLSNIAGQIASAGGYEVLYLSNYDPSYTQMFQDDEDDIAFLKRLALNAGVALKVTSGTIVLFDWKDNEERQPVKEIEWGDGSYSKFSLDSALSTTAYSSCHVSYEDDDGNTYEATFTPPTNFSEGEVLEVKEEVSSNAEAMTLAQKRLRIANKGEMTGNFTLRGDTTLQAGNNITLKGFGDFDGKWSIDKATHKISSSGYTTSIDIYKVIEGY